MLAQLNTASPTIQPQVSNPYSDQTTALASLGTISQTFSPRSVARTSISGTEKRSEWQSLAEDLKLVPLYSDAIDNMYNIAEKIADLASVPTLGAYREVKDVLNKTTLILDTDVAQTVQVWASTSLYKIVHAEEHPQVVYEIAETLANPWGEKVSLVSPARASRFIWQSLYGQYTPLPSRIYKFLTADTLSAKMKTLGVTSLTKIGISLATLPIQDLEHVAHALGILTLERFNVRILQQFILARLEFDYLPEEFLRKFAMGQSNLVTQATTDPLSLLRHFTRENCATLLDILGAPWSDEWTTEHISRLVLYLLDKSRSYSTLVPIESAPVTQTNWPLAKVYVDPYVEELIKKNTLTYPVENLFNLAAHLGINVRSDEKPEQIAAQITAVAPYEIIRTMDRNTLEHIANRLKIEHTPQTDRTDLINEIISYRPYTGGHSRTADDRYIERLRQLYGAKPYQDLSKKKYKDVEEEESESDSSVSDEDEETPIHTFNGKIMQKDKFFNNKMMNTPPPVEYSWSYDQLKSMTYQQLYDLLRREQVPQRSRATNKTSMIDLLMRYQQTSAHPTTNPYSTGSWAQDSLARMTQAELAEVMREFGIRRASRMTRHAMIDAILAYDPSLRTPTHVSNSTSTSNSTSNPTSSTPPLPNTVSQQYSMASLMYMTNNELTALARQLDIPLRSRVRNHADLVQLILNWTSPSPVRIESNDLSKYSAQQLSNLAARYGISTVGKLRGEIIRQILDQMYPQSAQPSTSINIPMTQDYLEGASRAELVHLMSVAGLQPRSRDTRVSMIAKLRALSHQPAPAPIRADPTWTHDSLNQLTVPQLRAIAAHQQIPNRSKVHRKEDLIYMILAHEGRVPFRPVGVADISRLSNEGLDVIARQYNINTESLQSAQVSEAVRSAINRGAATTPIVVSHTSPLSPVYEQASPIPYEYMSHDNLIRAANARGIETPYELTRLQLIDLLTNETGVNFNNFATMTDGQLEVLARRHNIPTLGQSRVSVISALSRIGNTNTTSPSTQFTRPEVFTDTALREIARSQGIIDPQSLGRAQLLDILSTPTDPAANPHVLFVEPISAPSPVPANPRASPLNAMQQEMSQRIGRMSPPISPPQSPLQSPPQAPVQSPPQSLPTLPSEQELVSRAHARGIIDPEEMTVPQLMDVLQESSPPASPSVTTELDSLSDEQLLEKARAAGIIDPEEMYRWQLIDVLSAQTTPPQSPQHPTAQISDNNTLPQPPMSPSQPMTSRQAEVADLDEFSARWTPPSLDASTRAAIRREFYGPI